jgi:hypothetical protein
LDTDAAGASSLINRIEARVAAMRASGTMSEGVVMGYGVGTVEQDGYGELLKAARHRLSSGR